jgi:hypothetical protein
MFLRPFPGMNIDARAIAEPEKSGFTHIHACCAACDGNIGYLMLDECLLECKTDPFRPRYLPSRAVKSEEPRCVYYR